MRLRAALVTWATMSCYYVQAFMFLLATVWTIQMRIPERSPESARVARESLFQSIKAGFAYVSANRNIRTQLILALGPLTLGMPLSAPRHIRGRVMSFYLISRATVPIGTLFAGALAHYFGGPAAVQMMSLSALGLVVLVISTHPGFLRLKVNLEEHADAPVVLD